jgi:hypothetical protein
MPAEKKPTIINEADVGPEILAKAIIDVSDAAKKLLSSRLTNRALTVLLRDATGLPLVTIEKVLNAAADLRRIYVK